MKLSVLTIAAAAVLFAYMPRAEAKRKKAPVVKICNKAKRGYNFASMSYAGKGRWRTKGWYFLRPGKCVTRMADRYYVRGAKRVGGLIRTWKRPGCIKLSKKFSMVGPTSMHRSKQACKQRKGFQRTFHPPNQAALKVTIWQ